MMARYPAGIVTRTVLVLTVLLAGSLSAEPAARSLTFAAPEAANTTGSIRGAAGPATERGPD